MKSIFCPKCGMVLSPIISTVAPFYHCYCGFDSRNMTIYYGTDTRVLNEKDVPSNVTKPTG